MLDILKQILEVGIVSEQPPAGLAPRTASQRASAAPDAFMKRMRAFRKFSVRVGPPRPL